MNKNCYKSEILNELSNKSICINTDKNNKNSLLKCGCSDHTKNDELREGNKLFVILLKFNDTWNITETVCWQCSVRNIVERLTHENKPIAIVEGTLQLKSMKNNEYIISEPDVWEIILSDK